MQRPLDEARLFRETWFGSTPPEAGHATLSLLPPKLSVHVPCRAMDELTSRAVVPSVYSDLYLGVGTLEAGLGAYRRGKRHEIAVLPEVWLKVDYRQSSHHTNELLPMEETALRTEEALGLPRANSVIDSSPSPTPVGDQTGRRES